MIERIQVENNYYENSNAVLDGIILRNNEFLFVVWDNNTVSTHNLILDEEHIDINDGRTSHKVIKYNPFIKIEHNGTKLKVSAVGLWAKRYSDD